MDERRKDPRFPMRAEAEVCFTSWAVFQLIWTVNISHGGMQIDLTGSQEPKTGAPILIKLRPPKGPVIELEAEVRHATQVGHGDATLRRWQVGVKFVNLDAGRKLSIEELIRNHGGPLAPVTLRKKDK